MSQPIIRPAQIEDSERIATLISELAVTFIVHEFSPERRGRFMAEHTPASIEERMRAGFSYHVAEVSSEMRTRGHFPNDEAAMLIWLRGVLLNEIER